MSPEWAAVLVAGFASLTALGSALIAAHASGRVGRVAGVVEAAVARVENAAASVESSAPVALSQKLDGIAEQQKIAVDQNVEIYKKVDGSLSDVKTALEQSRKENELLRLFIEEQRVEIRKKNGAEPAEPIPPRKPEPPVSQS